VYALSKCVRAQCASVSGQHIETQRVSACIVVVQRSDRCVHASKARVLGKDIWRRRNLQKRVSI
jgi:hypothetical protein